MKIEIKGRDKADRSNGETPWQSFFNPAGIVLVVSLVLLVGAGWLKSGGLKVAISGFAAVFLIGALAKVFRTLDFSSRQLANATPRQLAWIRMVVCLTALIYTLMDDLAVIASLPPGMRNKAQFFLDSIPGYAALVSSPDLLRILQWMTALLLFLALVGLWTRATLFLGAVGFFLIQAILRHYTYFYHSGLALVYLTLLLPWAPCSVIWSLDSWLKPKKKEPDRQFIGLSVYACFAVMASIYFMSGLSKLRDSGVAWLRGDNIEQWLIGDTFTPIFLVGSTWKPTLWLVQHHAPEFVFTLIGIFGLVVELGYITVLFSRRGQVIMPTLAFFMHLGILFFQDLLFLDLLILQFIFMNIDGALDFGRRRLRGSVQSAIAQVGIPVARPRPPYFFVGFTTLMLAALLLGWALRIEYYPLTSWRMYLPAVRKGPFYYPKLVATLENGTSITIPIRDCSPATPANARYLFFRLLSQDRRSEIFDQFLASYIERRNGTLAFGSPISGIEVQFWRWNWVLEPNDPHFGWIVGIYPYYPAKSSSPR